MKVRVKKYEERSPVEGLLLREQFGMKKYRKGMKRSKDKKDLLIDMALKKIEEKEKDDFILMDYRKRKVNILPE